MSVKNLIDLIDSKNCAVGLDGKMLTEIALDVIERFGEDLSSMKDWMDCVDKGLDLCKPEFKSKDDPYPNSANFKSTAIIEASNQFGNRAVMELLRAPKLVKAEIMGIRSLINNVNKQMGEIATAKKALDGLTQSVQQAQQQGAQVDPDQQKQVQELGQVISDKEKSIKDKKAQIKDKQSRADRVEELMNWQINVAISDWRTNQKRMMYTLPNIGSMFKKTFYDVTLGRIVSHVINYPDFAVNQSTNCIRDARSFTHIIAVSKSQFSERVRAGVWLDIDIYKKTENGDAGSNEANAAKSSKLNESRFLEQYCWLDLDDDGIDEPYIVTVHEASGQVVRIVARFNEDGVFVTYKDQKPMPLIEAQKARAVSAIKDAQAINAQPEIPQADDFKGLKVVRIEPMDVITRYGFIPSYDGSFLDLGYFHVIGAMTMGENKATNELLNAGSLSNLQTVLTAKGFRKRAGAVKVIPGSFIPTEVEAADLQQSILPLPFKEPSATLFQLNEKMGSMSRSFGINIDASQVQSNTAPTTALAIIQEQMVDLSAHNSRIIDSMSDEFEIIYTLNKYNLDADTYRTVVGDDEAIFSDDFNTDNLTIVPTAVPEQSSKMQRMMLAEAEMAQVSTVIQAGGNPIPIIKNYFIRMGSDNVDEIFPNEAEMSPDEKAQRDQMMAQQKQSNDMAAAQLKLTDLQYSLLKSGENRKDAEFAANNEKREAELQQMMADTFKTLMDAELSKTKSHATTAQAISDAYTTMESLQQQDMMQDQKEKMMQQDPAMQQKMARIQELRDKHFGGENE